MRKTVVVAMSGGVDSSVVAYLLKQQASYRVIGIFMKNWEEQNADGECCSARDYADVGLVADQLGIPYYTVSFVEEYRERVFSQFLKGYSSGFTPNPDILCNREVKFDLLQQKVRELGGDYLATGHYCRLQNGILMRGVDSNKDQSYFLSGTPKSALSNVLFPLGDMKKDQVRAIAAEAGLATATKKDSVGICFIGKRNFKGFIEQFIPDQPGDIVDYDTKQVVGKHEGPHCYTIGQRRGLDIGGSDKPCFVVGKDMDRGIVYIVRGEDHPLLYRQNLVAKNINWFEEPKGFPYHCSAKVRYRSPDEPCTILGRGDFPGDVRVHFSSPVKAITPGQAIAFYQGDMCIGGGVIDVPMSPEPQS